VAVEEEVRAAATVVRARVGGRVVEMVAAMRVEATAEKVRVRRRRRRRRRGRRRCRG